MRPIVNRVKSEFSDSRIIFVADRELNTSDNIYYLNGDNKGEKISKSDFRSRPVHVRTNEHIDAHFATCFTALVLIRLLHAKLKNKYPVKQILDSLRNYNCTNIDTNTWQFLYYDEILQECEKVFDIELNNKYRSQLQNRRLLRY